MAIGADGARGGWVAAIGWGDGERCERVELTLAASIRDVADLRGPGTPPVAVDVPIGLPDTVGPRNCDTAARGLLVGRSSAVFNPMSRKLLAATSYAEVRALVAAEKENDASAKGISAQSFGIAPKIKEVDEFARSTPDAPVWLWECHPELSFMMMAGASEPLSGKRSVSGLAARVRLVSSAFPGVEAELERFPHPEKVVDGSDALDALASLWTALRIRAKDDGLLVLGGDPDSARLPMRIAA